MTDWQGNHVIQGFARHFIDRMPPEGVAGPPREDWDSPFMDDEFVITAWWPPTMNQLHDYAAAHFNLGYLLHTKRIPFHQRLLDFQSR